MGRPCEEIALILVSIPYRYGTTNNNKDYLWRINHVSIPYRYGTTTVKSRLFIFIILKKCSFSTIFFQKVCHPPNSKIAVSIDFTGFLENGKYWKEVDGLFA